MTVSGWSLLGLAAIVLLLILRWIGRTCRVATERAWLPQDLRDAELAYAEQRFRAKVPVALGARVDRAYRHLNGVMVLVELKARHANRVYFSDVVELSAQRYALESHTGEPVARQAYVLVQQAGQLQKVPHRVTLLAHDEVVALVKRREAILIGMVEPQYSRWPKLCRQCAFRQQCKSPSVNQRKN
ncbi:PD-(D/E)XK nuclease family protein [Noviherbaspirillum sedimenti]|uniref:PD-(D/E)XK endonuclease-like domain-containing protein n=1 Tax=Noviherbaspirillum sedimenti TaxID=2320865 RepID=A0A3A3GI75_9BURK|nr:PD-(D/E)XK nuclease family protein [Noviherbaspirillum sedimenti]RJG00600.1 hypothetical protein D3878_02590 [Noviherbaspirillum sedimenti]